MTTLSPDEKQEEQEGKKRPGSPLPEDEPSKMTKIALSEPQKPPGKAEKEASDFQETAEMKETRVKLEAALGKLGPDTRNAMLLQAVHHYAQVKKLRDELLVRVGILDAPFAELIVKKAEEEGGKNEDGREG